MGGEGLSAQGRRRLAVQSRAPAQQNGWLDLRFFKNIAVSQAAGVGGGSLAYSSVALEANPRCSRAAGPPRSPTPS